MKIQGHWISTEGDLKITDVILAGDETMYITRYEIL